MLSITHTYAYDFFSSDQTSQNTDIDVEIEDSSLNLEQKHLAKQHDQDENNYKVLKNLIYNNDSIRIYNYTAYNTDDLKNKMTSGLPNYTQVNDLSISFGYGMSYQVDSVNRIGYEYISSFPYDRGQVIRFFWVRSF